VLDELDEEASSLELEIEDSLEEDVDEVSMLEAQAGSNSNNTSSGHGRFFIDVKLVMVVPFNS
jgi:hypothetical protein